MPTRVLLEATIVPSLCQRLVDLGHLIEEFLHEKPQVDLAACPDPIGRKVLSSATLRRENKAQFLWSVEPLRSNRELTGSSSDLCMLRARSNDAGPRILADLIVEVLAEHNSLEMLVVRFFDELDFTAGAYLVTAKMVRRMNFDDVLHGERTQYRRQVVGNEPAPPFPVLPRFNGLSAMLSLANCEARS